MQTPGLRKTNIHKEIYQQACLVKLCHYIPSWHREYVEVQLYRCSNSVLEGDVWSVPCPRFGPGKETWYPLYIRLDDPWGPVWIGLENITPTGVRTVDRPAPSELLYRLRCPLCHICGVVL